MSVAGAELARLVGGDHVLPAEGHWLEDATEARGLRGSAEAVVLPGTPEEVAAVVAWCYEHDVPITPRGGGTGFAGGAVPLAGGVVLALDRLARERELEPGSWRMAVEAGTTTATVRRRARENGLLFPPDPGAAEQSQIGGNVATNAGGPHAFKYGVTGAWVTGLEVVVPPGELVTLGGRARKDVVGYDLRGLLVGSEGTLGVVTAAWLRLVPAPEATLPVVAAYRTAEDGCAAVLAVMASGLVPAALEYLDRGTLEACAGSLPEALPDGAGFLLVAEADGPAAAAAALRDELVGVLGERALAVHSPSSSGEVAALWRWRDGVSIAVTASRGGKVSEDVVVPVEHLAQAVAVTVEIGERHGLPACSWGHAGDGNLHATFMVGRDDADGLDRAERAAAELFALAGRLGGSISGEHGIGVVKRAALGAALSPAALALQREVKCAIDPKGLMNPGKAVA